jgi:hypothetical protein
MFRLISISSFLGIAAVSCLSAGQIQIGALVGNVNNGITANYITSGCAATNGPSFANCVTGSVGTNNFYRERDYAGTLFTNNTKTSGAAIPIGYGLGCNTVSPGSGCLTDTNGVTFALLNDGLNGSSPNNYWTATGDAAGASGTLTIPIGVFNVNEAWTMINDQWGTTGVTNTVVTFYFGTSSNTTDAGSMSFSLVNGVQVRDATQCGASNASGNNCTTYASTASQATAIYGPVNYSSSGISSTVYNNTSGTLALDDQAFNFGSAYAGDYLSEVTITDENGGTQIGRTGISAITVNQAPEPGTLLMIVGSLGLLGIARFRKQRQ